ncbi:MAG: glycosyltransferase family 4 protein [Steroidobacteraceae bacterium]|nr:glycosyltransferase family 4 protein [Steroidobacteraceae bacterium]
MRERSLEFIVPGDLRSATGGYIYDRRILEGLRASGWRVAVHALDASFPLPTPAALDHARDVFSGIPDGALTVVDGLAFGAMPEVVSRHARRLRIVALVHHPLANENGLSPELAHQLAQSERVALRSVRRVVVTSEATADALIAYDVPRGSISVIVPGTDDAPLARGSADGVPNLLCVATLIPRKGHDLLIDSLHALAGLPWRLTCAGSLVRSPETAARVQSKVRDAGLAERVDFPGELNGAELARLYESADLFVLPTRYEGYGMAVAEALAFGLPVVSTRTGGIPGLVGDRAGLLVPPDDGASFARALARVLTDHALLAGLRVGARESRSRLPRWPQSCARMSQVLEEVMSA